MTAQRPTASTTPTCSVTPIGAGITVAVVHAEDSHPQGSPLRRHLIDGDWPLRQRFAATKAAYLQPLQLLVAVAYRTTNSVRRLEIIDVRWITGHTLVAGDRVHFATVPAPQLSHLLGSPSPAPWLPGQAWPVKVVNLPMAPSATFAAPGTPTPGASDSQDRSAA